MQQSQDECSRAVAQVHTTTIVGTTNYYGDRPCTTKLCDPCDPARDLLQKIG